MAVSDFECQIARGQIGRYLGGGALSSEAMTGLEDHLAECPACKALVAERRAALLDSLSDETARAVVSMPVENPLVAALRAKVEPDEPAPNAKPKETPRTKAAPRYAKASSSKPSFGKPLALAALLAVVLVGMSYVSRMTRGQGTLGQKAAASFAAGTIPDAPVAPKPSIAKPAAATPKPTFASSPKPLKTVPKPTVTAPKPVAPKVVAKGPVPKANVEPKVEKTPAAPVSKPVLRRPLVRRTTKPVLARKRLVRRIARKSLGRRRAAARTSVRVYGLDGHPLKP